MTKGKRLSRDVYIVQQMKSLIILYMRTYKNKSKKKQIKQKKQKKQKKQTGGYSASDYGNFVWGTNQVNNPAQGNVIQVLNDPSTPLKIVGGQDFSSIQNYGKVDIPSEVISQSPQLTQPTNITPPVTGGRRTRRKKR